jgi:hypothetical protein
MVKPKYDRVVIGGGLFGSYAALVLAKAGHAVLLVEKDPMLMMRASAINQARLHTGLHYPRSLNTAKESQEYFEKFRTKFPTAILDFDQVYAISAHNSKTTATQFESFIERLGIVYENVKPELYFNQGTISAAFRLAEPTFDANEIRRLVSYEISTFPNIEIALGVSVIGGDTASSRIILNLDNGDQVETSGVVIAAYAGINSLRSILGLNRLPLSFEIAEVSIGVVGQEFQKLGFTVMDGPFWSMMPFGKSGKVSLTSVGMTPLLKSKDLPQFGCQSARSGCTPLRLADCNSCHVRPKSGSVHQIQQMGLFLRNFGGFQYSESLMTVKTILSSTEVDDARPTLVRKEPEVNITTIFSGKVSTVFDLEKSLI